MALLDDRRLVREITIVLVLKLCALIALWWLFIADHRVEVDEAVTGDALIGAPPPLQP